MNSPQTILLVEDREEDVFFLRRALSNVGANVDVRVVTNGAEAQAYLLGREPFSDRSYYAWPDLIVCDFKMPRRNGVEFLQWLRAHKDFESLPFVLLSGSCLPHEERLALDLGANLYLRKTADFARMRENVQAILRVLQNPNDRPARNPDSNRPPLVLVIDDEPKIRRMIDDFLRPLGFDVMPAHDSREGLACARLQKPDVVLCDVVLPDSSGFETAQALKQDPATASVPVILMTGYPYMRQYMPDQKWPLLFKPLSAKGIFDAVSAALSPTSRAA
jgi:CheY-like chemotaxis protein